MMKWHSTRLTRGESEIFKKCCLQNGIECDRTEDGQDIICRVFVKDDKIPLLNECIDRNILQEKAGYFASCILVTPAQKIDLLKFNKSILPIMSHYFDGNKILLYVFLKPSEFDDLRSKGFNV